MELGEDSVRKYIKEYIQALEEVDKAFSSLIWIYDHNVGQTGSKSNNSGERSWLAALGLLLLRLFGKHTGPYGSIKIDDKHLEELKADARRELTHLQRVTPIVAAHARLRQLEAAQELKKVCDLATEGPERTELPSKLAIQPANLLNKRAQVSSLTRVIKHYEASHGRVLERVEALDKFVGKKFAEDGTNIFRSKKDRNWIDPDYKPSDKNKQRVSKKGKFRRLIAKLSCKKAKKFEVLKGGDSDVDSISDKSINKSILKEEWREKA